MSITVAPLRCPPVHAIALLAIGATAATCATTLHGVRPEFGLGLALLLTPFAGREAWRALVHRRFVHIVLVFAAYAAFQILYLHAHSGESLQHFAAATSKPVKLGLLGIGAGVWLSRYPRAIAAVLALMLVGLLAQTILGGIAVLGVRPLLLDHVRLAIGYPTNLGAMFFAMAAVGSLIAAIGLAAKHGRVLPASAGCAAASAFFFLCLALSGTRGSWLAALVAMAALAAPHLRPGHGPRIARPRGLRLPLLLFSGIFLLVAMFAFHDLVVSGRSHGFWRISDSLLNGDAAAAPTSSVGIRLQLLHYGLLVFTQHPFVGVGLASIKDLIAGAGIHMGSFVPAHMHNAYLQALVGLGGIGSALMVWGAAVLARDLRRAWGQDPAKRLLISLMAAVGIVAAIANLSDSLVWRLVEARIPFEVLLGCALALSAQGTATVRTAASTVPRVPPQRSLATDA